MRHPINSLAPHWYLNNNEHVAGPKMGRTFHFPPERRRKTMGLFFLKNT
jgi:hypothetical protein